jgi:hypothetical protein
MTKVSIRLYGDNSDETNCSSSNGLQFSFVLVHPCMDRGFLSCAMNLYKILNCE